MIAEYKLYHGAVLAELVDRATAPIVVDELSEEGRLSSYVLNESVGMMIKHSTNRLHPWSFTFTKRNAGELLELNRLTDDVYVVMVCHTDGMVCLTFDELNYLLAEVDADQVGIRVDRRPGHRYAVSSGLARLGRKKPSGVEPILAALSLP